MTSIVSSEPIWRSGSVNGEPVQFSCTPSKPEPNQSVSAVLAGRYRSCVKLADKFSRSNVALPPARGVLGKRYTNNSLKYSSLWNSARFGGGCKETRQFLLGTRAKGARRQANRRTSLRLPREDSFGTGRRRDKSPAPPCQAVHPCDCELPHGPGCRERRL